MLVALLEAMRPHQWLKNTLVFAPLLFAHKFYEGPLVLRAAVAFGAFCLLSSAVYLFNDILDREADRRHPAKRLRPIASGRLPVGFAAGAAALLAAVALGCALAVRPPHGDAAPFVLWPAAYALLNLAYSLGLKRLVIVDCLCIALGFLFRVLGGAAAIGEPATSWILLCTFFLTLFLAFCKRREECKKTTGDGTRATMREYTLPFLDQLIAPLAALSILSYALYTTDVRTTDQHGPHLIVSVPFVVFGVFRYLFLVHRRGDGGDPARDLVRDPQLVAAGALWLLAVVGALAAGK